MMPPRPPIKGVWLRRSLGSIREDIEAWLNGSVDDAREVLRQYDPSLMDAYEVSTLVNKPDNNEPSLLQPMRQPQPPSNKAEPTQQEDLF